MWWPDRVVSRTINNNNNEYWKPLSSGEADIAVHHQKDGGTILYTKIGGFSGSSTRTELAAGIVALQACGPVHIGSDSSAFVTKANILLE